MTLLAAVVNGHLAPLARVVHVAVALGHELFQGVVPVHQHACEGRGQQLLGERVWGCRAPWGSQGKALPARASSSLSVQ